MNSNPSIYSSISACSTASYRWFNQWLTRWYETNCIAGSSVRRTPARGEGSRFETSTFPQQCQYGPAIFGQQTDQVG